MDIKKLEALLSKHESPIIEFKSKWYNIDESFEKDIRDKEWGELIKDIISLINANIGYSNESRYLIIGASDTDPNLNESREIFNIKIIGKFTDTTKLRKALLKQLNNKCSPSPSDISISFISTKENKQLLVIKLDPPKDVVELVIDLVTPKQIFRKGTVLYRDEQMISVASPSLIKALSNEFTVSTNPDNNQKQIARSLKINTLLIGAVFFIFIIMSIPKDLVLNSRGVLYSEHISYGVYGDGQDYPIRWAIAFLLSSSIPSYFWNIFLTPRITSFWDIISGNDAAIKILRAFSRMNTFLQFTLGAAVSIILCPFLLFPVTLIFYIPFQLFLFSANLISKSILHEERLGVGGWLFALIILFSCQSAFIVLMLSSWKLFINKSYKRIFIQDSNQ